MNTVYEGAWGCYRSYRDTCMKIVYEGAWGCYRSYRDTCMNIVYEGDGDATGLTETPDTPECRVHT